MAGAVNVFDHVEYGCEVDVSEPCLPGLRAQLSAIEAQMPVEFILVKSTVLGVQISHA